MTKLKYKDTNLLSEFSFKCHYLYSWFIHQLINFLLGSTLGIGLVLIVLSPMLFGKLFDYDYKEIYHFPLNPLQSSLYIVISCGILGVFLGKNFIEKLKNSLIESICLLLGINFKE